MDFLHPWSRSLGMAGSTAAVGWSVIREHKGLNRLVNYNIGLMLELLIPCFVITASFTIGHLKE